MAYSENCKLLTAKRWSYCKGIIDALKDKNDGTRIFKIGWSIVKKLGLNSNPFDLSLINKLYDCVLC